MGLGGKRAGTQCDGASARPTESVGPCHISALGAEVSDVHDAPRRAVDFTALCAGQSPSLDKEQPKSARGSASKGVHGSAPIQFRSPEPIQRSGGFWRLMDLPAGANRMGTLAHPTKVWQKKGGGTLLQSGRFRHLMYSGSSRNSINAAHRRTTSIGLRFMLSLLFGPCVP